MRTPWRFVWILPAMLTLTAGIAENQVSNGHGWQWWWVVVGAVATVLTGAFVEWAIRHAAPPPVLTDGRGRPPLVRDVRLTDLGIYPTRFGADGGAPYLVRDVDDRLRAAVRSNQVVVVRGRRLAGTSRALAEAVLDEHPRYRVVVPPAGAIARTGLAELVADTARWAGRRPRGRRRGVVLWLERLHSEYLDQLHSGLVAAVPARMLVCVTCASDFIGPEPARLFREGCPGLKVIEVGTLSAGERDRARQITAYQSLYRELDVPAPLLWGRLLVDVPVRTSEADTLERRVLLLVIKYWGLLQMSPHLTEKIFEDLYRDYWQELKGIDADRAMDAAGFAEAMTWAQQHDPQLVNLITDEHGTTSCESHPLLAVAADPPEATDGRTISTVLWRYAVWRFPEPDRRRLGMTYLEQRDYEPANTLLSSVPANTVEPAVMLRLGEGLEQAGRPDAARYWYEQTVEANEPRSAARARDNIGRLDTERARTNHPRQWWHQTIGAADEGAGQSVNGAEATRPWWQGIDDQPERNGTADGTRSSEWWEHPARSPAPRPSAPRQPPWAQPPWSTPPASN